MPISTTQIRESATVSSLIKYEIKGDHIIESELEIDGLDLEPSTSVTNPLTGDVISLDDIDGLITAFAKMKDVENQCYAARRQISEVLAAKTIGDAKTRRIEGSTRKAKVEFPDDSWDQPALKDAWERYPNLANKCLKIGTINVMIREYKKLKETAGEPILNEFRNAVVAANRGPLGAPRITVEV